jgi:DNA polymerase V
VAAAKQVGKELFREGIPYAKAGVGLLDIRTNQVQQADLFCAQQSVKSEALMATVDKINRVFDKGIFLASNGIEPAWKMNRSLRSPSYTTKWSELPKVRG